MKFLIIAKVRQTPVDVWSKLLPAHFKYLDELERKKTVEVSYHLIGHQGDALIVNASSDEELAGIIGEDPLFFYTEREIYPAHHTRGSQTKTGTHHRKDERALAGLHVPLEKTPPQCPRGEIGSRFCKSRSAFRFVTKS